MDFAAAGLLEDLTGDARAERERLLEQLLDQGFTEQELITAVKERRLALLPVDRVLAGRYTAAEIEARTGLPAGTLQRRRRQLGLPGAGPEDRVFGDEDVAAADSMRLFLDAGFDQDRVEELTRVLGEGMARLAAATTDVFADTFLEPGSSEAEVAARFPALTEHLAPAIGPILLAGFQAHLRDAVARAVLGQAELASGDPAGAQDISVCFADLVGFTRLGGNLEAGELGTLAGRLATLATGLAEPPVRLIKTIGDAAMFISPEPAPLVEVALRLVAAFEEEDLPSLRAGVAFGPARMRGGDYYGHAVNLASRVTGAARPGSVLCTREIRDAARDGFDWSAAGRHRLKGVSERPPLYRARPSDGGPEKPGDSTR